MYNDVADPDRPSVIFSECSDVAASRGGSLLGDPWLLGVVSGHCSHLHGSGHVAPGAGFFIGISAGVSASWYPRLQSAHWLSDSDNVSRQVNLLVANL